MWVELRETSTVEPQETHQGISGTTLSNVPSLDLGGMLLDLKGSFVILLVYLMWTNVLVEQLYLMYPR